MKLPSSKLKSIFKVIKKSFKPKIIQKECEITNCPEKKTFILPTDANYSDYETDSSDDSLSISESEPAENQLISECSFQFSDADINDVDDDFLNNVDNFCTSNNYSANMMCASNNSSANMCASNNSSANMCASNNYPANMMCASNHYSVNNVNMYASNHYPANMMCASSNSANMCASNHYSVNNVNMCASNHYPVNMMCASNHYPVHTQIAPSCCKFQNNYYDLYHRSNPINNYNDYDPFEFMDFNKGKSNYSGRNTQSLVSDMEDWDDYNVIDYLDAEQIS